MVRFEKEIQSCPELLIQKSDKRISDIINALPSINLKQAFIKKLILENDKKEISLDKIIKILDQIYFDYSLTGVFPAAALDSIKSRFLL